MPNMRLSGLWAQIPWRRRKEEPEQSVSAKRRSNAPLRKEWRPFSRHGEDKLAPVSEDPTSDKANKRVSRIWKTEDVSDASPTKSLSASYRRFTRSFEPAEQDRPPGLDTESVTAFHTDDSFLKRLRRKSQTFSMPRPRTSSGVTKRRSFFGGTADQDIADITALPSLPEEQQRMRPRHVPISIDYLQFPLEGERTAANRRSMHGAGPGMAITSNDVQDTEKPFTERPRGRPLSLSSSFSQLRFRTSRTIFSSGRDLPELESDHGEDEQDEHDLITALPSVQPKDLRRPTSSIQHSTRLYSDGPYAGVDRHVLQRVTPKMIDIVAPRPVSMISATSTPTTRPTSTSLLPAPVLDRHKSMFTPIMNDEDGPKGDWSRTRHSWRGVDSSSSGSGSEQLEWEKLKQFMEAYSAGGDTEVVSIRQVEDESDSSGSVVTDTRDKHSNAQALAALEFGLN